MIGIRAGLSYDLCSSRTSRRHPGSWKTLGFLPWILMIYGFFKWHNYGQKYCDLWWFMDCFMDCLMDNLRTKQPWLSHMSKLSLRLSPDQSNPWFFPSRSTERKNNALPVSQTDRLISYGQVDLHGFVGLPWYINGLVDWENTYGSRFRFSQENQSIEIYHEKTWKNISMWNFIVLHGDRGKLGWIYHQEEISDTHQIYEI